MRGNSELDEAAAAACELAAPGGLERAVGRSLLAGAAAAGEILEDERDVDPRLARARHTGERREAVPLDGKRGLIACHEQEQVRHSVGGDEL